MSVRPSVSFFLMTQKGYSVLYSVLLQKNRPEISFVVSARDSKIKQDFYDEIAGLCAAHQIPFFDRNDYPKLSSDYAICISWRWLLPVQNTKLIVLHDSLLPKYRGFAPLVNQLINQEKKIGVTALFADDAYDEGNILFQKAINIEYPIRIQKAIDLIAPVYSELVLKIVHHIAKGSLPKGIPQQNHDASYSLWRDEEDYYIDWSQSSDQIERFVHAVGSPYDGAKTRLNGETVIIEEVSTFPDRNIVNRDVGKVICLEEGFPIVVCGTGLLKIEKGRFQNNGRSIIPLRKFRSRLS